jgi:hypothetical protein
VDRRRGTFQCETLDIASMIDNLSLSPFPVKPVPPPIQPFRIRQPFHPKYRLSSEHLTIKHTATLVLNAFPVWLLYPEFLILNS